jgi:hypothetical protein
MKRLLALALSLAAFGFVASPAEAKAAGASASAAASASAPAAVQWRNRRWDRRNNRRVRTVTQSRLVRVGRRVYRETYQIRYLPNGRTQTRLISRVRVR